MSPEARLEDTGGGLAPATEGWFVVNVRDASWVTNGVLGDCCIIEGGEHTFPELGFTIGVLQPGQSGGRYHGEANQEDFLVLAGECLLLIEGEERTLRAWDFVHCPPWTEHAFVGAGDAPGRRSPSETTAFDSTGLAIQDLAIALAAYEVSHELDLPQVDL